MEFKEAAVNVANIAVDEMFAGRKKIGDTIIVNGKRFLINQNLLKECPYLKKTSGGKYYLLFWKDSDSECTVFVA
jgi:hypothetical protein